LHILHYQYDLRLAQGGVTRAVIDMAQLMADAGHQVTILTGENAEAPKHWRPEGKGTPRVVQLARRGFAGMLYRSDQTAEILELLRSTDVVHIHGMWIHAGVQIGAMANRLGKPIVFSPHGMLDDWSMAQRTLKKRVFLALYFGRLLKRASVIHCTAEAELDQASRWFDRSKGRVAPCVVDLRPYEQLPAREEARRRFGLDDDRLVLLFLSRLHYKKRPQLAIEGLRLLRARGVEARLLIAGTGEAEYQRSLERQVAEANLNESVTFVGHVDGERKLAAYRAADLMVLPTSQENFGLVNVESLACGTPIVTTRGVDIWRDLQASGAASIVDPTAKAVADAAEAALTDRVALQARGEAGRQFVLDWLNPDNVAENYVAIYKDCRLKCYA